MIGLLLTGLLLTQTPAPTTPPVEAPKPPMLAETTELKRSNAVLRLALLRAQMEAIQAQIEKERASIEASLADVRKAVEQAHQGWTLDATGKVVKAEP